MSGVDFGELIRIISIGAIPVLFAITLHEVAHGWVAKAFGDPTAHLAGRLSLNPLRHVDLIGTVVVPIVMVIVAGPIFGWAKPVPVAVEKLGNPRRDMIIVAAAGPGSNLVMALGWALVGALVSFLQIGGTTGQWLVGVCQVGMYVNVVLAIFNLVPIPPLDGGRVLAGLLPPRYARVLDMIEPFGILILLLLLFTVLWGVLEPVILAFNDFFFSIAGLRS